MIYLTLCKTKTFYFFHFRNFNHRIA